MNCVDGLLNHFKELEKDFHHHYVEVMEHCEPETVHQLRLNMKRQLAFFNLLEFLDESFSTERAMEAYGKLYKKAGKVRDFQVEQSVVHHHEKELEVEREFSDWLKEKEAEERQNLQQYGLEHSLVPVRRLAHLVESRIRFLPEEGLKQRFTNYFGHLFNEIRHRAQSEERKEEMLHPLRKYVKELFYNVNMLNGLCTSKKLEKETIDALHDIQKLLGDWHDTYFTLEHMEEEQENCPGALMQKVNEERAAYVADIEQKMDRLPALADQLETQITEVLDTEPLEVSRRPARERRKGHTHPSFKQLNVDEGTK